MDFKFRNIFHRDIDQVFSYKTNIEVVILDRYVGIIFRIFQMTVIAYFLYIVTISPPNPHYPFKIFRI